MAEASGDRDVNTRFTPMPPGSRNAPPPPPRPEIAKAAPPPATAPPPPPAAIVASRALWIMGFLAGIAAVVIAFYAGDEQRSALQDVLAGPLPEETAATLERIATVLFWVTLGAILVVILVESLLLSRMMGRHGGVRWLMLLVLAVHAVVAVFADAFLSGGDVGIFLRLLLLAQLLLAGVALILSFLPGTGRWFRTRRDQQRRA